MLNSEEAQACIQFLDRCPVTGHQERYAMNTIVNKLAEMVKDPKAPPAPPAPLPKKKGGRRATTSD